MADCLFCRIVAGEIPARRVHEDELCIAFHDIRPKAAVHVLLVPRLHVDSLEALEPRHDTLTAHLLRVLPPLARRLGLEDGFRTAIHTGPAGGQEIYHLHLHLLGGGPPP